MDVLVSAFSVCHISSHSLLGGYCKHVRLFDMNRPGRNSTSMTVGDKMHQNNNSIVATLASHPTIDSKELLHFVNIYLDIYILRAIVHFFNMGQISLLLNYLSTRFVSQIYHPFTCNI